MYSAAAHILALSFVVSYLYLVKVMFAKTRELRAQERIFNPQAFHRPSDQKNSKQREYKSKFTLLGTPLFHFQFSTPEADDSPAVGWIGERPPMERCACPEGGGMVALGVADLPCWQLDDCPWRGRPAPRVVLGSEGPSMER